MTGREEGSRRVRGKVDKTDGKREEEYRDILKSKKWKKCYTNGGLL